MYLLINLQPLFDIDVRENTLGETLYQRTDLVRSFKRVKFETDLVDPIPELIPDLPEVVAAFVADEATNHVEVLENPVYPIL